MEGNVKKKYIGIIGISLAEEDKGIGNLFEKVMMEISLIR